MQMRPLLSLAFATAVFLGLGAHGAVAQGAKDPFLGKWVMDVGKSTFMSAAAAPSGRVMTLEAVGSDGIRQIVDTTAANGVHDHTEFTAKFDGTYVPISASVVDTVALKRISPTKVERYGKRKFTGDMIVETQTRELNADGKQLTIVTKGVDFDGNPYENTQVFTKMP